MALPQGVESVPVVGVMAAFAALGVGATLQMMSVYTGRQGLGNFLKGVWGCGA